MSTTKIGENTSSMLNFGTSNKLSYYKYRKTSLILVNSIHLLLPDQVYYKFFYNARKETNPKTSKVATAKTFFSSVYVIVATCFNKCFLFHEITGRHCFYTTLLIPWGLFNRHVLASSKQVIWKKTVFYFLFPQ